MLIVRSLNLISLVDVVTADVALRCRCDGVKAGVCERLLTLAIV